jgi:hypothetical protein
MKQNLTIIPVINKIDLPHATSAGQTAVGGHPGHSRRHGDSGQRQGGHRHRGNSGSDRRAHSGAEADGRAVVAGAGLRFLFRHLQGRRHARARVQRRVEGGHAGQAAALRQERRGQGSRQLQSQALRAREIGSGRDGLFHRQHQEPQGSEDGRHHHRRAESVAGAAGLQGDSSDGVQRDLSDQHRGLRASQGEHGQAAAERLGVCLSGGNVGRARASVSAAASSACCIWKSCRNGCAANTAWTSSRRIRAWSIA